MLIVILSAIAWYYFCVKGKSKSVIIRNVLIAIAVIVAVALFHLKDWRDREAAPGYVDNWNVCTEHIL